MNIYRTGVLFEEEEESGEYGRDHIWIEDRRRCH
jgi:hypothetical protein